MTPTPAEREQILSQLPEATEQQLDDWLRWLLTGDDGRDYLALTKILDRYNQCTAGLAETYACGPEGSGAVGNGSVKPRWVEAGTKPCSLVGTF